MLPYCLVLDNAVSNAILSELAKTVTIIDERAALEKAVADKIGVAVASPMKGVEEIWFDRLSALKLIAVNGVGTDRINLAKARSHGIDVTTTLNILTEDVADLAFALLLAVTRKVTLADRFIRYGRWAEGQLFPLGTSLRGKKLGIVGLGAIGCEIAKRGEAFGMLPRYYNRTLKTDVSWPHYATPVELATDSDVLVVAISATPETVHSINSDVFTALGAGGYIINIARGSIINESDLIGALKNNTIAGAGLDVFLDEPHINAAFLALDNAVLTPHVGSATVETRTRMGQCVIDNVNAVIGGEKPINIVN